MKQFNLTTTKIAELTEDDFLSLKNYLLTIPIKDYVKFLLHVLDTETDLSDIIPKKFKEPLSKANTFLSDPQFFFMLHVIELLDDEFVDIEEFNDEIWKKIEKNSKNIPTIEEISKILN